jgi:serine/threonine-protein kinase
MRTIGKYEIQDKIGGGSMGTVYAAHDTVLDRDVALKILRTPQEVESEAKLRFYREAAPCARLQHANIVSILDIGEVDGAVFIAMENVPGMDLGRKIQWPVLQKVGYMAQVCDALAYAHQQKVLHRDIKPSNLFLCADYSAKVLDFGLAKLAAAKKLISREVPGTPDYEAPEQILGNTCDSRADIFSAAVVFCEFLTGVHPFAGLYIPRRIVEAAPTGLRQHDPQIPESLERFLFRALDKAPHDRVQTAAQFAQGLRLIEQELRSGIPADLSAAPAASGALVLAEEAVNQAGESDLGEWRVKEFVRLLSDFDESIALQHVPSSQRVLEELSNLARSDQRLAAAFADCQKRLTGMANAKGVTPVPTAPVPVAQAAPAPAPQVALPSAPVPAAAAPPEPLKPPAPAQNFKLGDPPAAKMAEQHPPAVEPPQGKPAEASAEKKTESKPEAPAAEAVKTPTAKVVKPVMPAAQSPVPPMDVAGTKAVPSHPTGPVKAPRKLRGKQIGIAAAVVVLLAGGAGVARLFTKKNIPAQPALARAVVQAASTGLMPEQHGSGAALAEFHRGDQLNILAVPMTKDQEWVHVQRVLGEEVSAAGYVKTGDLADWSSADSKVALALLKLFAPSEVAPEAEIGAHIEKLKAGAAKFAGSPETGDFHLEIARLYFALGRLRRIAGAPLEEWQGHVAKARAALDSAKGDATVEALASRTRQQLDMLVPPAAAPPQTAGTVAPPAAAVTPPAPSPEQLLRQVSVAWDQGNYKRAMTLVDRALAAAPDNAAAKKWKERIRQAQADEAKLQ